MTSQPRPPAGASRQSSERRCVSGAISQLSSIVHPHGLPYPALVAHRAAPHQQRLAWVRDAVDDLLGQGLSALEAGNVVAYAAGLHAAETGWTPAEIQRLLVVRARVACRQLSP